MAFGFDPSIILQGKQYTGPDANETMRTLADLALRGTQQRQAEAAIAEHAEQQNQARTLRSLYSAHADSPEQLPTALMRQGFGPQAFAVQDQAAQMQRGQAEFRRLIQEEQAKVEKQTGEAFYGVKDQAGWDGARLSLPPQIQKMIPETFDGEMQKRLEKLAIPAKDLAARAYDEEQKRLDRENRTKNATILAGDKKTSALNDDTTGMRKEVNAQKEIVKYRQASAELNSLKELAKSDSGASDMAIVFAFMKAMDPESVVRESEYSAAAATGTPDERMKGLVKKWWTGGPLTASQRNAFIKAAEGAQSGHKSAHDRALKTFRYSAKKRGIDMQEVGIGEAEGPHGKHVTTESGVTYTWNPSTGDYE